MIATTVTRLLFVPLLFTTIAFGQELSTLKRIHVGSMGQRDEAERFRMLLEEQLIKRGFEATDKPESADAILTGVLAIRVYADKSIARATVVLRNKEGARLWGGDFQPRRSFKAVQDTVKFRAENIASDLFKAYEKARKGK